MELMIVQGGLMSTRYFGYSKIKNNTKFPTIYTKFILDVCSMVYYLSNQLTNTFMFGIILNSYLFSMLGHKFHEDVVNILWIYDAICYILSKCPSYTKL